MKCEELFGLFKEEHLTFFTGVPDSTFKAWMSFLHDKHGEDLTNIIACNECEAVAVAAGYHLATHELAVVYMQNSGVGKTVNPLTSLTDKEVYSIPMIMMIGWRGQPGEKDEPQHKKMGRVMIPLLETLEVPYSFLSDNCEESRKVIKEAVKEAKKNNSPYALIVKKELVEEYKAEKKKEMNYEMKREEVIEILLENINKNTIIVSTTGKTSRELFEMRVKRGEKPEDFYTVGSMGCTAGIGLGLALQTKKKIVVLDGDGATLMQMGSVATVGHYNPPNLFHVIVDNSSHESTGGQPTVSQTINFEELVKACGYKKATTVTTKQELLKQLEKMKNKDEEQLEALIIKVNPGSRKDLGRPTTTPIENKETFMEKVRK